MNHKKVLLGLSAFGCAALLGAATMAGISSGKLAGADDASKWVHYNAQDARLDLKGSKEYWVNCSTHERTFTKPSSSSIEEGGDPSVYDIYHFADADEDRVVDKTRKELTFDDSSDADVVYEGHRSNFSSKQIVDGVLEISILGSAGTGNFTLKADYIDQCFADPDVVAINFDAKCTVASALMYRNVVSGSQSIGKYDTKGLETNWKTFSWTRDNYDLFVAEGKPNTYQFGWFGVSADITLYLDNIRPVTTDFDAYGFETGYLSSSSTDNYASFRDTAGQEVAKLFCKSGVAMEQGFSYDIHSEGNRSLYALKTADMNYFQLFLPKIKDAMADTDYVSIDVYSEGAWNSNTKVSTLKTGADHPISQTTTSWYLQSNTWTTLRLPKSEFNSSNTLILNFASTSVTGYIYFDNIHIVEGGASINGFEDESIVRTWTDTSSVKGLVARYDGNDSNDWLIKINGNVNSLADAHVTTSNVKDGSHSLYFRRTKGNSSETSFHLSSANAALIQNGYTLSFDLFTTDYINSNSSAHNIVDGMRGYLSDGHQPSCEWAHYTFDKTNVTSDGRFLIIAGSVYGDCFIDNIVVADPSL